MGRVRPAAVAGSFYPEDAEQLEREVERYLGGVSPKESRRPQALLVPHAGYRYSGPVAASAYALLAGERRRSRRVVLLGLSHFEPTTGLVLPDASAFATPLGVVDVDERASEWLVRELGAVKSRSAHAREHSLEVQLPFLQTLLGDLAIVPVAVGRGGEELCARAVEALAGDDTLFVVSTDFSHFLQYEDAVRTDRRSADKVLASEPTLRVNDDACGASAVNGFLVASRRMGLEPVLLDLRNSGDTAGDRSRVVGYGAFAFFSGGGDDRRAR